MVLIDEHLEVDVFEGITVPLVLDDEVDEVDDLDVNDEFVALELVIVDEVDDVENIDIEDDEVDGHLSIEVVELIDEVVDDVVCLVR